MGRLGDMGTQSKLNDRRSREEGFGLRNFASHPESRTQNLAGGGFSRLQPCATHLIIPITRHQKASNCGKRMRREPLLRTVRWDV